MSSSLEVSVEPVSVSSSVVASSVSLSDKKVSILEAAFMVFCGGAQTFALIAVFANTYPLLMRKYLHALFLSIFCR